MVSGCILNERRWSRVIVVGEHAIQISMIKTTVDEAPFHYDRFGGTGNVGNMDTGGPAAEAGEKEDELAGSVGRYIVCYLLSSHLTRSIVLACFTSRKARRR